MPITGYSDAVYDAIKTYLSAAWTDTQIQWVNEEYAASGDAPFVKVQFHGAVYGQETIGANTQAENRWDREGNLWLYVMVPRNSSFTNASGAAVALAELFRGQTMLSGAIEFMDANIGMSHFGDEEGAWFIVPVSIEWRHINA